MRTSVLPAQHTGKLNATTVTVRLADSKKTLTGSLVHLQGSNLRSVNGDLTEARPYLTATSQGAEKLLMAITV